MEIYNNFVHFQRTVTAITDYNKLSENFKTNRRKEIRIKTIQLSTNLNMKM